MGVATDGRRLSSFDAASESFAHSCVRIERMQRVLEQLVQRSPDINPHVETAAGDVALSVNWDGRLMSLWLAPGCTNSYTNIELEGLINSLIAAAAPTSDRQSGCAG